MKKKGLSAVVTTLLLIMLSVAAVAIIWTTVNNLVNTKLQSAQSCLDTYQKVSLGNTYTCYNSTSKKLQFEIDISDISVDSVLVGISGGGSSSSFSITNQSTVITNLGPYPSGVGSVSLPAKNSGKTYVFNVGAAGLGTPDSIEVAPVVGGSQCQTSDTITQIDDCANFVP